MASNRVRGNRTSQKVILDSSAILMLFEYSIDLENEITRLIGKHHIIVPKTVIDELVFLSQHGQGKKKYNSKPALEIAKKYDSIECSGENVDSSILNLAKKHNAIVVTNDKELQKRINREGLKIICMKGKKQLMIK